jgi:hypothetical protein
MRRLSAGSMAMEHVSNHRETVRQADPGFVAPERIDPVFSATAYRHAIQLAGTAGATAAFVATCLP